MTQYVVLGGGEASPNLQGQATVETASVLREKEVIRAQKKISKKVSGSSVPIGVNRMALRFAPLWILLRIGERYPKIHKK